MDEKDTTDKKLELWIKLGQFIVGTVILGVATGVINWQIQKRQVEIKELEQLGKFVEHALDENLAVRHRFAEYFATVSGSDEFRERWTEYKTIIDIEIDAIAKKAKELELQKQQELAETIDLRNQLTEMQRQYENLKDQYSSLRSTNSNKTSILREKLKVQQEELLQAQSKVIDKSEKLAVVQSEINLAKNELTYTRKNPIPKMSPSVGWVYLGEYNSKTKKWLKTNWNISTDTDPMTLKGKDIQSTVDALNVRNGAEPWADVLDVVKRNTSAHVESVQPWGTTGYFWARITY